MKNQRVMLGRLQATRKRSHPNETKTAVDEKKKRSGTVKRTRQEREKRGRLRSVKKTRNELHVKIGKGRSAKRRRKEDIMNVKKSARKTGSMPARRSFVQDNP
jgi:hypothetical protein